MLHAARRTAGRDPVDLASLARNRVLALEWRIPAQNQQADNAQPQRIHFTGSDLSAILQREVSAACRSRPRVEGDFVKYWSEHAKALRFLLRQGSNEALLARAYKLDKVAMTKTQLEELTPHERSVIIKRLLLHYVEVYDAYKLRQRNKARDVQAAYEKVKAVAKDVAHVFNVLLNGHSRALTARGEVVENAEQLWELSQYDLENVVDFYFQAQKSQRCVELLAAIESLGYTLSDRAWAIKVDLLGRSGVRLSSVSHAGIFKGYSGAIEKGYEYPHHVNDAAEMLRRYGTTRGDSHTLASTDLVSAFIRAFGAAGDLPKVEELVARHWNVHVAPNGAVTVGRVNMDSSVLPVGEALISIFMSYAHQGELVQGLKVCLAMQRAYSGIYSKYDTLRFWHLVLKATGQYGCQVSNKSLEAQGAKLVAQYELFDAVWKMCQANVGSDIPRSLYQINLQYGSLDSLLECIGSVHHLAVETKHSRNRRESGYNKRLFRAYLGQCVATLAGEGKFLKAGLLVEYYVGDQCVSGRSSLTGEDIAQREQLQESLRAQQEAYAVAQVRRGHEQGSGDASDDDDFALW